jgi:hypothetical protein
LQFHPRPVSLVFQSVEEPILQGLLFLLGPRLGIPSTLVLGFLDQANFLILLDEPDAALD